MKSTILSLFMAVVLFGSFNAHAIPPVPPSTPSASIFEEESATVTCRDLNSLTEEEIVYFESLEDEDIISVYLDIRHVCYRTDK